MRAPIAPVIPALVLLAACAGRTVERASANLDGFAAAAAREQLALESRFAASLDAANLRKWLQELTARPHHTGSPGGRQVAEQIAAKFRSWGFETKIETFYALMSLPGERRVEMIAPRRFRAALEEPPVPGRTPADTHGSLPPYNVYSSDGDVTADAVYVNYGLPEDYAELERLGIGVAGKIVVARYGRAYRGIKPRLAAAHGAVGTLLFSDPADAGIGRGAAYPKGPFLPLAGYQRGSVLDITRFPGDPLTPGKGATQRPRAFDLKDIKQSVSPVPVLPLSASDAQPILEAMSGPDAPTAWQGGLPLTYRVGGKVRVRLKVAQKWTIAPLHNVVATLGGSTWPDEWILRGNNHDAWNYGALVAGSGLVAMLEEARAIGVLAQAGWRPRRTLMYLAWDAEEQGLLGSTEWAETHADALRASAVAYLGSGINTRGVFAAGGSHALETLVNGVARDVRDPAQGVPVHERAVASIRESGAPQDRDDLERSGRLRLAALGLGSDFTPFLQHLGIASLDYAFEGDADSGVYHSIYDNFDFYDRFGDAGYAYGRTLAEASGRTMLRLANADVLPFDFAGTSHAITTYLAELEPLAAAAGVALAPLQEGGAALRSSAARYARARATFDGAAAANHTDLARLNALLRRSEQVLAPAHGLAGRPWYRHQIYAPGMHTGYAVKTLPAVREALERRQPEEARIEIGRVAGVLARYASHIDECSTVLEGINAGAGS